MQKEGDNKNWTEINFMETGAQQRKTSEITS